MGLLHVRIVVSGGTVYAFVEAVNSSRSRILPQIVPLLPNRGIDLVYLIGLANRFELVYLDKPGVTIYG
jgi:hypothetical protein